MNIESNSIKINKTRCSENAIVFYKQLRPCFLKLFTHFVLLYISVRSFYLFADSNDSYSDFLGNLKSPVLLDVRMIDYWETCPTNYTQMASTWFPKVHSGCRCDFGIYTNDVCQSFNITQPESYFTANCKKQDIVSTTRLLQQTNTGTNPQTNTGTSPETSIGTTSQPNTSTNPQGGTDAQTSTNPQGGAGTSNQTNSGQADGIQSTQNAQNNQTDQGNNQPSDANNNQSNNLPQDSQNTVTQINSQELRDYGTGKSKLN
jgi:hypothetical protein